MTKPTKVTDALAFCAVLLITLAAGCGGSSDRLTDAGVDAGANCAGIDASKDSSSSCGVAELMVFAGCCGFMPDEELAFEDRREDRDVIVFVDVSTCSARLVRHDRTTGAERMDVVALTTEAATKVVEAHGLLYGAAPITFGNSRVAPVDLAVDCAEVPRLPASALVDEFVAMSLFGVPEDWMVPAGECLGPAYVIRYNAGAERPLLALFPRDETDYTSSTTTVIDDLTSVLAEVTAQAP